VSLLAFLFSVVIFHLLKLLLCVDGVRNHRIR
jgi:hypothetical protein